jgi:hypothetical protein
MNDHEQHFVVVIRQGMLGIEQFVEMEVLRVAEVLAQVPVDLLIAQIDERPDRRCRSLHSSSS